LNDKRTGFGVPEIKLGLLPGAGGTQRLVQKLSLLDALDLILTGKEVKAKKAKSMGLVDDLVEPIGPGLQATEAKNLDYLRTVAVAKAKYVYFLKMIEIRGCDRHSSFGNVPLKTMSLFIFRELTVRKPVKKQPSLIESKTDLLLFLFNHPLFSYADIRSKILSNSYVRNYIFQQAQKKVMSQTQGLYPAPLKILDVC
jgi:enoyl-CoA hydratase/long-chain 3-hydroxyacyl-CoA dehydrogenase